MEHLDSLCILFALCMTVLALTRCPHAWELVDKTEIPAPVEIGKKAGLSEFYYDASKQRSFSLERS